MIRSYRPRTERLRKCCAIRGNLCRPSPSAKIMKYRVRIWYSDGRGEQEFLEATDVNWNTRDYLHFTHEGTSRTVLFMPGATVHLEAIPEPERVEVHDVHQEAPLRGLQSVEIDVREKSSMLDRLMGDRRDD